MLDEIKVPLTRLLAGVLWLLALTLVALGSFGVARLEFLGLVVLGVAMMLTMRCMLKSSAERERVAFDLGRECGSSGARDSSVRTLRP